MELETFTLLLHVVCNTKHIKKICKPDTSIIHKHPLRISNTEGNDCEVNKILFAFGSVLNSNQHGFSYLLVF
jgi:hypothetical protein